MVYEAIILLNVNDMRVPPSHFTIMRSQSRDYFMAFLHTELELGLNLVGVAKFARMVGYHQWSGRSVRHAKEVYTEVARYLANPRYAKQLSSKQRQGVAARMDNLRKCLDRLPQSQDLPRSADETVVSKHARPHAA